jgi:hypothetical protein
VSEVSPLLQTPFPQRISGVGEGDAAAKLQPTRHDPSVIKARRVRVKDRIRERFISSSGVDCSTSQRVLINKPNLIPIYPGLFETGKVDSLYKKQYNLPGKV